MIIFSFLSVFIVTGSDIFLNQKFSDLDRIFTNPTDIIGKFDNISITVAVLLFIIVASASTNLVANVWQWHKSEQLDAKRIQALRMNSPLGMILAAGLLNRKHSREIMKESIATSAEFTGSRMIKDYMKYYQQF